MQNKNRYILKIFLGKLYFEIKHIVRQLLAMGIFISIVLFLYFLISKIFENFPIGYVIIMIGLISLCIFSLLKIFIDNIKQKWQKSKDEFLNILGDDK